MLRQRPTAFDLDVPMPEFGTTKPLVYLTLGTVSFGTTDVLRRAVCCGTPISWWTTAERGTVLGALAAGLPQLVLPQGAGQFVNAITGASGHLLDDPDAREVAGSASW